MLKIAYQGYLADYVPLILSAHQFGDNPSEIARMLVARGLRIKYGYPDSDQVLALSSLVRHILTRYGRVTRKPRHSGLWYWEC